jgi:hypothetical protein
LICFCQRLTRVSKVSGTASLLFLLIDRITPNKTKFDRDGVLNSGDWGHDKGAYFDQTPS